ncbi:lipopolysaccharide biosynthesis protein [Croceibacterium sp. LX-88]|uniref:Lipopolysaccharide biosynthesis protein n=1 Tax=Croceibacterium selenioxidans TaxID=2838833 RepID=A0ABS5W5M2_9SPHN|nr:lipopolysaccharide biosynthesis protein [Croceibacterium selenioxidans]MBT2135051.1 lipopolysaccharide biosynthesis protein [Croceibacterium selenioxidans]
MTATGTAQAPANGGFRDRVRTAVAWRWGSQVLAQVITWTTTIVVVRLLAPADYGLFAMTQAVLVALNFLNGYGFATSLIQAEQVTERRISQVYGMLILANGALAMLQFLAAPLAAEHYGQAAVADMLKVQALVFLTTPFIAVPSALLARQLRFRGQAVVNLACAFGGAATALALAALGYGVWALVWAPIVVFGIRAVGLTIAAGQRIRPTFDFRGSRDILTFGSALMLSQLFWVVQSQSDIFIAGRSFTAHELGLYSEALFVALILTGRFLPPLNEVAFPAYAELAKQGKPIGGAFVSGAQMIILVTAPLYIGLSLTAGPLVETVFGPKWLEMIPILSGLALAMPAMALQIVCSPATNALGNPRPYLYSNMAGAVIMPACFLIGASAGAPGLVASWQVAAPLLLAFTLTMTLPKIGVRPIDLAKAMLPAIVGCGLMALAVIALDRMIGPFPAFARLALLSAFGGTVYAITLWLFWPEVVRRNWEMIVRSRARGTGN